MRVCHIITSLALGGAETQLLRFVSNDDSGTEHVVCFLGYDDSLVDRFENAGVEVHSFGGASKIDAPIVLYRTIKFLRKNEFDIIHAHQVHGIVFGRIASILTGSRPIITTHQNVQDNYGNLFKYLETATRSLDTVTIAVSEGVKKSFATKDRDPRGNWDVVYNSIQIEEFQNELSSSSNRAKKLEDKYGISSEDFIFLNVGRYAEQKNQKRLIEAMDSVVPKAPNAKMFIVGWGKLQNELEEKVQELDIQENVYITGRASPIHEYYYAADAFVLSSHFEGLSIASVEALSAGLPIIGTDVPGVNEVVVHEQNGYLVEPDSASELSNAIHKLIGNSKLEKYGKKSSALAEERFSITTTIEAYFNIYQSCVRSK